MRCPSCGSEVSPAAACSSCGAPLPSAATARVAAILGTAPAAASSLRFQIVGGNAFACARIELAPNQSIRAEAGAMVSMLQTRNLASLAGTLFPLFPSQQGNARSGLGQLFGD